MSAPAPEAEETDAATALVQGYCGWHVAPSVTEDLVLDGSGSAVLLLPTLHLTDVQDLVEDGTTLDPTAYQWSASGYLVRALSSSAYADGDGWLRPGRWTPTLRGITVTITHGYDEMPADLAGVITGIGERLDAGGALLSKTIGPFSESYGDPYGSHTTSGFSSTEQTVLDRYRLPWRL